MACEQENTTKECRGQQYMSIAKRKGMCKGAEAAVYVSMVGRREPKGDRLWWLASGGGNIMS
jgi:hypothetical protein